MATYKYREEVFKTRDEVMLLYRKIQNQRDNLMDLSGESEVVYNDFLFYVAQAKESGLEPEDATELNEILAEVSGFRQSLGLWN